MSGSSYQPVIVQPSSGGDLITGVSPENVGGSNYVIKRDWRRIMDGEARREGHIDFAPNSDASTELQTQVADSPITLVHFSRKPNGQTAVIVGTQTALYRYFSFEDGGVFTIDVFVTGVFLDSSGQWLVIGDNFSEDGHRWEAVEVAGKTVFNNGVDTPVVYDLGWLSVRPLYEFREQGFAFAGTIEEFNGMLALADLAEISPENLVTIMEGRITSSVSQAGTVLSATTPTFTAEDVGKTVTWDGGQQALITQVSTSTTAVTNNTQAVPVGPARIAILYGTVSDTTLYSRVQYKIVFSNVGDAEDFGSGTVVNVADGSTTISLSNAMFSINEGDLITIPGAGADGAAFESIVLSTNGNHDQLVIADPTITTVEGVELQRSDRIDSLSQAVELQDNGSPIIRMMELQGRLVVLKDNSFFVGQFTGSAGNIIQFQKVYGGPNCIGWKWMLTKMNNAYLLYASPNGFYTFELSSLTPQLHPKLFLCQGSFFNVAQSLDQVDEFWMIDNDITNEVWIMFPNAGTDQGIMYDHRYNTCSTITQAYTSGGMIYKPVQGAQLGVGDDWFIMGTEDGRVLQYGLTDLLGIPFYTRDGETYTSDMLSGLLSVQDQFNESDLRNYVVYFGGTSGTPVTITLYGGRNANEARGVLFTRTISSPTYKTLIPTYFRQNYYQDRIVVEDSSSNCKIVRRVYEFLPIDSRSTIRNNST